MAEYRVLASIIERSAPPAARYVAGDVGSLSEFSSEVLKAWVKSGKIEVLKSKKVKHGKR